METIGLKLKIGKTTLKGESPSVYSKFDEYGLTPFKTFSPELTGFYDNLYPLIVDFDSLPEEFEKYPTHEALSLFETSIRNYMKMYYSNLSYKIIRSYRGYPKIVFHVRFENEIDKTNRDSTHNEMIETVKDIFPDWIDSIDFSWTAMTRTYICSLVDLNELKTIDQSKTNIEIFNEPQREIKTDYYKHEGDIPKELQHLISKESEERLMRIIIRCWKLSEEFDLPQKKLAKEADTSQRIVSQFLSKLKKKGLLKIVNSSYIVGVKAKTYKAVGILLKVIQNIKNKIIGKVSEKIIEKRELLKNFLPEAGQWDDWLFKFVRTFYSKKELEEQINHIKGIEHKGRKRKAISLFGRIENWRFKNRCVA